MRPGSRMSWALAGAIVLLCSSAPALSGVHLWRITEAFSNSDGTIQFIEMTTCCGSAGGEIFLSQQPLTSNSHSFTFPGNLTMTTANKHLLLATSGFAALTGAPAPDYTIPSNFFSPGGDTLTFSVYDTWTFGGIVPTDGNRSLNKNEEDSSDTPFVAVNSPTNLHEQTGSVSVVTGPPAVPDGTAGTQPLMVSPLALDGSRLQLSFDTTACTVNASSRHILYGQKSGFPPPAGSILTPMGAVCNIGSTSPYDWLGAPNPTDGFNLIWIVMVTTDPSGIEGSWGENSSGVERRGPGTNGSSGICANDKSVANACGH
jgi:hypothetical protein